MHPLLKLKRFFIGKPLRLDEQHHELLPKWKALAVLSSDALSSVAYATEEILIALVVAGSSAMVWSIPIALVILALMLVVTLSYRMTIDAYPNGGGAYTVAKENLGSHAGLVAGAALMIDYILTLAVSVAAGTANLASAFPSLQNYVVLISLIVILGLTLMSLRGISEQATFFAYPTYFFIFSMAAMLLSGAWKIHSGEGVSLPTPTYLPEIGLVLIFKAFASGCSAMTGIEAITNGIPLFREPKTKNAKTTMSAMVIILGFLFFGTTYLANQYVLQPLPDKTIIAQLASGVFGDGPAFYIVQACVAMILFLAANTAYAGFPALASLLARDRYAPRQLASIGDKLVFSNSIFGLSLAAAFLIFIFQGEPHALIPLYAVGVFLSFSLSQAGMVVHHLRKKESGWKSALALNFTGAIATTAVLLVITYSKFSHGAWIVVFLIPSLVFTFSRVHRHYLDFSKELGAVSPSYSLVHSKVSNRVIIPISGIHVGVIHAIQYGNTISSQIQVCMVETDPAASDRVKSTWNTVASDIPLTILPSPYRSVLLPLLDYIDQVRRQNPGDYITILVPEFVTAKWYHQFLHNQTAFFLKAALIGKPKIVVTSVRYHLKTT